MTLYELLRKVSSILGKNNANELFEYFIHSMDYNGGFLRSRYCYWDKTLSDFECSDNIKTVLVTLRYPFDFCNSTEYYEECTSANSPFTLLKMQIFLYDLSNKERMEQEIMWSCCVGFAYPIKIDLINETFFYNKKCIWTRQRQHHLNSRRYGEKTCAGKPMKW